MTFYHQEEPPSPFPKKTKSRDISMKVSGEFPGSFNIYTSPVFFSVIEELFLTLDLVLVWMEYYKLFTNEFRNSVNECL